MDSTEQLTYVFDIDGTLADPSERLPYIIGPNKDWDTYDSLVQTDKPIPAVITILRCLREGGYDTLLLTGRGERTRDATAAWLAEHGVTYDWLVMRADGDNRPDTEVKMENLERFVAENGTRVQTIFEDRKRLAQAFRAAGYHVCHVAEGDF